MQILHGKVALWAWVCAGCVRVRGLEILYWPGCYKSFTLQRSQCHSHLLCTSSHIEELYVITFLLCPSVFRKGNTYSCTSATVCMLWKNDYSSWSILKVLNDFCNSFECFTYLNTSFILGIYMRKIWAFGFHLGCFRHLWCCKLKSKKRSVIIDSGWISAFLIHAFSEPKIFVREGNS